MGLRVRLKASFDGSGFPPQARIVLTALKRYGMMVADNGSNWFISGAPDPAWDNDDLRALGSVKGSDFEVVDTSSLEPGPTAATITAFSAARTRRAVSVRWKTASELDVLGYVVHRQGVHGRTARQQPDRRERHHEKRLVPVRGPGRSRELGGALPPPGHPHEWHLHLVRVRRRRLRQPSGGLPTACPRTPDTPVSRARRYRGKRASTCPP